MLSTLISQWALPHLASHTISCGRAHCDIKIDNIRIKVGDDGTICGLKVIDLGGSIKYKGKLSDAELLVVVP